MTTIEACDVIVNLTAELRDEKLLRTNLEADVAMYRELLTVALTQLHDWQLDPARTARRQEQKAKDRYEFVKAALRTEAA